MALVAAPATLKAATLKFIPLDELAWTLLLSGADLAAAGLLVKQVQSPSAAVGAQGTRRTNKHWLGNSVLGSTDAAWRCTPRTSSGYARQGRGAAEAHCRQPPFATLARWGWIDFELDQHVLRLVMSPACNRWRSAPTVIDITPLNIQTDLTEELNSQQRAGHRKFEMTQKYIRTAEAVGEVIGAVFPPLPESLVAGRYRQSNRPSDLQLKETIEEAPGIEPGAGLWRLL